MDYSVPTKLPAIVSTQVIEVPCFTALPRNDSTPLEFRIDKSDLHVDPTNVHLYVKCTIESSLEGDEKVTVYPANNLAYTMWQNVEMYIADQKITMDQTLYPWFSYLVCLTQFSKQYRDTVLQAALWDTDTWGTMDTATGDNMGAVRRSQKTTTTFELYSKVLTDFVQLPRLLPSQAEITYRFIPSNPSLYLVASKGLYALKILDAKLYVGKTSLSSVIPRNPSFPVCRYQSRTKTVNVGEQNVDWVLYSGRCPRRVYVTQVLQQTFNGSINRNPFNLQTFGVRSIQLFLNDVSLPTNIPQPLSKSDVVRCYTNTANAINSPSAWDIGLDAYMNGFFVYAVDLTTDHSASSDYMSPTRQGTVRLTIDYQTPLAAAAVIMCFIEVDDVLTLDDYMNPSWS